MSSATLTLKPIVDLMGMRFRIPAYQRGYRWTPRQVKELLDDIQTFHRESDKKGREAFYCLQPIVVKERPEGGYDVIDGQQRLTTIYLVLTYLLPLVERRRRPRFTLEYQTHPDSAEFLNAIDLSRADENIDYNHICLAYSTVEQWFADHDPGYEDVVLRCLLDSNEIGKNVQVIWYELHDGQDPIEVFIRLNMGKIPLTNSELIRALFLRSRNFKKNDVSLKQIQIAQEWDSIEKALQASDFWGFIYEGKEPYPARIEYLFELITSGKDKTGILEDDNYATFIAYSRYFESVDGNKEEAWRDVKNYFMTCEEWFRDRTLYHLVGFLITRGMSVTELWAMGKERGKSAFQDALKSEIYRQLFGPDEGPDDHEGRESLQTAIRETLSGLSYDRPAQHDKIRSALLLFNVVTLLQNRKSAMRFPFDSFKSESWDLEHIKSVKSEMPARREDQKAWIQTVLDFWQDDGDRIAHGEGDSAQAQHRQEIAERMHEYLSADPMNLERATELFVPIYDDVLAHYHEADVTEVDNGMHNLTLLDSGTNRSYKNAVFPVKRDHIRRLDKSGTFVPLCTTNVFLKYYSKDLNDMLFWTEADRVDYFGAMVDMLTDFFMVGKGGAK